MKQKNIKISMFKNFKKARKSRFTFDKEWKKDIYSNKREIKNSRRISLWNIKYKNRVFDRNMINGLCFSKFYGRQKIKYKRIYGNIIIKVN